MRARLAYTLASVVVLLLQVAVIAYGQGQGSLDISIPSSFPVNASKAYDSSNHAVGVWGNIDVFKYGSGIYVGIPTDAPDGSRLGFLQDTSTGTLFRNNTLVLPIHGGRGPVANFVLMTGDLRSSDGRFTGRVTGMELDTRALAEKDAAVSTILYLDALPDNAAYGIAISDDDHVKNAILGEASKDGRPGILKLMVDIGGTSPDARGSIGYAIVRMKCVGPEPEGNVTAYRYYDGLVSKVPYKTIRSADGTVYETISSGPGVFAFVGPFREPAPIRSSMQSVVIFAGALALSLILLIIVIIRSIKWSTKK